MRRKIVLTFLFLFLVAALTTVAILVRPEYAQSAYSFTIEPSPWVFAGSLPLSDVPEPSGITYYPGRNTFFVVDDGGVGRPSAVYEIELVPVQHPEYGEVTDTKVVGKLEIGKDLEGVCLNWTNGFLYVCDESNESIYEIAPDGPKHLRTFKVAPNYKGQPSFKEKGNGFEGIAFRSIHGLSLGGEFFLANQDDPTCVLVVVLPEKGGEAGKEAATVKIQRVIESEQINLGDLMYDEKTDRLWLSHAWQNLLQIVNPDTGKTVRWELLPGCAQEGITIDADGRFWIGQDVGGLAVYDRKS